MAIHQSVLNLNANQQMMAFFGEAGSGKTTAATELFGKENTLYFDCENGSKFIEGLTMWSPTDNPIDRPFKWEHFEQAAKDVILNKFKAIAIDNFFNLCEWLEKYVCQEASDENKTYKTISDFGFGKGEKKCKKELFRIINYFNQANIGVVLICHKKTDYTMIKTKDTSDIEQKTRNTLNLPKWAAEVIVPNCDYVFYFFRDGFGDFRIKLSGDETTVAKDRSGTLPEEIPNNPIILRRLIMEGNEKMATRVRQAKENLRTSWEDEAENYLKELGIE